MMRPLSVLVRSLHSTSHEQLLLTEEFVLVLSVLV